MKRCDYCGRESDDAAVFCHECGTPFRTTAAGAAAIPLSSLPLPQTPGPITAGGAVVLLWTGLMLACLDALVGFLNWMLTKGPLPALIALFLSFLSLPYSRLMLVLLGGGLAFMTATRVCRAPSQRLVFTAAVTVVLGLEWWILGGFFSRLVEQRDHATVWFCAVLLIVLGALLLAPLVWRVSSEPPPPAPPPIAPGGAPGVQPPDAKVTEASPNRFTPLHPNQSCEL